MNLYHKFQSVTESGDVQYIRLIHYAFCYAIEIVTLLNNLNRIANKENICMMKYNRVFKKIKIYVHIKKILIVHNNFKIYY